MVVDEKQKQRVKKRTFSINASALMPSHSRKASKVPTTLMGNAPLGMPQPTHVKNNLSVNLN